MAVDNDHEEGNSKKCTSIEHVEGTEKMEVNNDHEEGKSRKCTSIEHVEGKMNLDSGEMKRTNGEEKKDGHDQDSEMKIMRQRKMRIWKKLKRIMTEGLT